MLRLTVDGKSLFVGSRPGMVNLSLLSHAYKIRRGVLLSWFTDAKHWRDSWGAGAML
jgi:hypothetical protein